MNTRKLTYEERVQWFFDNYYESGMEYPSLLENLKDADLDRLPWYGDFIAIPREVAAQERWSDAEILFVLSGFTDAAPAEYIKTNLIDLLHSYRQHGHFPPAISDPDFVLLRK